ncbi:glycerol-3-phosphate ABC transporter ATP-binding protein [Betaproteobacteria bacterium GR16-43]|nr:glycerol-3-phosphate ABC transporter ATP-binding protein [Betaproteobacteria bacterium GR16-43]
MAVVRLDNLSKRYTGTADAAVDRVSFTVADGEFMVLLGPSGCGKSTTLRMIAGLEAISEGALWIDGRQVNTVPAKDRDIAMVFQSYALYPHMTVRDNLAFGLRRRDVAKAEIERRVALAASILGLEPLLERKPFALSGGQRQRVALGRAIVREPKVFLFDEPLSNLDAALRVATRNELVKLHRRLGVTMIYVTHDQVEAMTMGQRICVMNRGRVAQIGAPLEVYRNPADAFVARFLGSPPMNLFPATLRTDGGRALAAAGTHAIPLERWRTEALSPGREVLCGIRPEAFEIAGRTTAGTATVTGSLSAIEPLGAETLLLVDLGPGVGEVTARVRDDVDAPIGSTMALSFQPASVYLFDRTSELAIPAEGRA